MNAHEVVALATQLLASAPPTRLLARVRSTANGSPSSPWITVHQAAARARCGIKLIYREVRAGRLQAAKVGGRRELRLRPEWVDAWLQGRTEEGSDPGTE